MNLSPLWSLNLSFQLHIKTKISAGFYVFQLPLCVKQNLDAETSELQGQSVNAHRWKRAFQSLTTTPSWAFSLACDSPCFQSAVNLWEVPLCFLEGFGLVLQTPEKLRIQQVSSEKKKMFIDLKLMKSQFLTSSNTCTESFADFSFSEQHQLCVQAKACSSAHSQNQQMPKEEKWQAPESSAPKDPPFSGIVVYFCSLSCSLLLSQLAGRCIRMRFL